MLVWSGEEEKNSVEPQDSSSSDDDGDNGRDEAQYRITVPLDVRMAPPSPLFTTPALSAIPPSHPSLTSNPPVPVPPSLPAVPVHPVVHTPQLAVHGVVRPLLSVTAHPAGLMSVPPANVIHPPPSLSHHQQQSLMMPVSAAGPLVRPPRCRDYDGEYVWMSDECLVWCMCEWV